MVKTQVLKFRILILIISVMYFVSCGENKYNEKVTSNDDVSKGSISNVNETSKDLNRSQKPINNDPCVVCGDNFKNFPKDSSAFEILYGYPNGTRQEQSFDEIQAIFRCLKDCYVRENLVNLINLSAVIKYDADGPSYLQSNLHEYIKGNKELVEDLYSETKCDTFKKHLKFLFEGIDSKSIKELEVIFDNLNLNNACKSRAVKDIPKMISNDH